MSVVLDKMTRLISSPGLVKFVAGALRGSAEEQEIAKEIIKKYATLGGAAGAGIGAAINERPKNVGVKAPAVDWRQEYSQKYSQ